MLNENIPNFSGEVSFQWGINTDLKTQILQLIKMLPFE